MEQKEGWYNAYEDTPSKKECDNLCEKLSGKVVVYKIKVN